MWADPGRFLQRPCVLIQEVPWEYNCNGLGHEQWLGCVHKEVGGQALPLQEGVQERHRQRCHFERGGCRLPAHDGDKVGFSLPCLHTSLISHLPLFTEEMTSLLNAFRLFLESLMHPNFDQTARRHSESIEELLYVLIFMAEHAQMKVCTG